MCGIAGMFSADQAVAIDQPTLDDMCKQLFHRGPDEGATVIQDNFALGFTRLSIIDLANGQQPFYSEDQQVQVICNGEIFNHIELRKKLQAKGYHFRTNCDIEVLVPLYLEYGMEMFNQLNGQFSIAIVDRAKQQLTLARDQFGICPLFYTKVNDQLLFASEIKALLKHPDVRKRVDMRGFDQVVCFPGTVSPRTMFCGIKSIQPGHYLTATDKGISEHKYWDLDYPEAAQTENKPLEYYLEGVEEKLLQSIKYRLQADVPVGYYLSGGLDSSLIGGLVKASGKKDFESFSIGFPNAGEGIDERSYQRLLSRHVGFRHHEINFSFSEVRQRLEQVVYHAEAPVKETYNVCSIALSEALSQAGMKVTLCGEGADELFGGYYGYKFDQIRQQNGAVDKDLEEILNDDLRSDLWADPDLDYDFPIQDLKETREMLYPADKDIDVLTEGIGLDHGQLQGRDPFHKRSYLDFKLRLAGHLIADHGDRMTYANSIEGRYPFLDVNLVEFVRQIPAQLKLHQLEEKYILKQVAKKYIPNEIINRQKFGFVAPASPDILKHENEWVMDLLSYDRIKRQGYLNPDKVAQTLKRYATPGFKLNAPYGLDLLMIMLSFQIFLNAFDMD